MLIHRLHLLASISLVSLILLTLGWETVFAPLKPGGSWMVLKTLPLLFILPGILRGRLYTCQYASMLILAYFAEGVVRTLTDQGLSAHLAAVEILLSLTFFIGDIFFVKLSKRLPA
ncbi:MAG TPA: DUF2069 domain-containing protein [Burkholderiales bacterium]|nr:DUF2069 domain-containing protein [Pseudomonadota bacterium]HVC49225.1 DUF2069 domain-containing protein [Burkholderiales bacterium]